MEPQRFGIPLTLGLILSMALSVANLVSRGDAGSGKSEDRGGLPPDREASRPVRDPAHAQYWADESGQDKEGHQSPEQIGVEGS